MECKHILMYILYALEVIVIYAVQTLVYIYVLYTTCTLYDMYFIRQDIRRQFIDTVIRIKCL